MAMIRWDQDDYGYGDGGYGRPSPGTPMQQSPDTNQGSPTGTGASDPWPTTPSTPTGSTGNSTDPFAGLNLSRNARLEGYDWAKLANLSHRTPKYDIGRYLLDALNRGQTISTDTVKALLPKFNTMGWGEFDFDRDMLRVKGTPHNEFQGWTGFDLIRDLEGGGGFQWNPTIGPGAGSAPAAPTTPPPAAPASAPAAPALPQTKPLTARDLLGAPTANRGRDYTVPQAFTAMQKAWEQIFGEPANNAEIYAGLRAQGWKPGDQYVGERGFDYVLGQWTQQAAGRRPQVSAGPAAPPAASSGGGGGSSAGDTGVPYSDPGTELFTNEILSRLEDLRGPIDDPFRDLYELMALARVGDLNEAPFTAGEDAALVAHYMNPLTQARDARREMAKERMGARGMLPTSGLFEDQVYNQVDQDYERNVAGATNDLAVRAIDERQKRAERSLEILTEVMGNRRTDRGEEDARAREIVQLASLFPELDERRLNMLLAASGEGAMPTASLLSTILGIGNQNLAHQQFQQQQKSGKSNAMGQYVGYVLNNLDKFAGIFGWGDKGKD